MFVTQLGLENLHHAFVVFKTPRYWWSIEKDMECILLQRSENQSDILQYNIRCRRPDPVTVKEDKAKGRGLVEDLIFNVWQWRRSDKAYNLLYSNCQYFANVAFNCVNSERM